MLQTLGEVLPQAAGIVITPVAVIIVILMLISDRGKVTAPAFVLGWMVGVAAITVVALLLADGADAATEEGTRDGMDIIRLALGVLFIVLAVKTWRSRPRDGESAEPKFFSLIDSLSVAKSVGIGLVLATVIAPKNLALELGSGGTIAENGLTFGGDAGVVIIFTVVASLSVLAPVVAVLVLGERASTPLAATKEWLTANNTAIMMVLFVLLAAHFVGEGLGVAG